MQFGHFESAEGVGPKGLGSLAQASYVFSAGHTARRARKA